ncbi:MAG: sugar-binding protein [Bacteroidales bacterium]|nr:sugar-binding protein [Bacteroidales bacterium]
METQNKVLQIKLLLFAIAIFSLGITLSSNANTYYVSTSGSDADVGTSTTHAWQHIAYATGKVKAGDIVYVKAGNYGNEKVVMTINGTSTSPITFEGYKNTPGDNPQLNYKYGDPLDPTVMPLLDGNNRTSGGTGIQLDSRQYVIVKNFQIRNYVVGVYAYGVQHVTIDNIIATTFGDVNASYSGKGIAFGSSAFYNSIKNCVVLNAGAEGLSVTGDNNLIDSCRVYCDEVPINPAMDYYIIVAGNSNIVNGCYVERVGNLEHGGHGITLKTNCVNNKITNCIAKNMAGEGFAVRHRGVKNNSFDNCIAYGGSGFVVRDGASNNIFRTCRSIGSGVGAMFYDTSEDGGAQYAGRNNIFENCIFENSTVVIDFDVYDQVSPVDSNTFINCTISGGDYLFNVARTNNYNRMINCIVSGISNYKKGPNTLNFTYTYSDFWSNSFATPTGTGNISVNPLFVDAANGNYQLQTGSLCINAGTSTGAPTVDFAGVSRPQGAGYDIGAYEYVFNSPTLTVTPSSLAFGNVLINTTSAEKTYTLTGSNLTTNVTVTAPAGYEVSKTTGTGFASSVTVTQTSGNVNQTIYVRFKPTAVQAYNGNVTNASTGVTTQNVALTGSGNTLLISKKTLTPLTIDGNLNDCGWNNARSVTFTNVNYSNNSVTVHTLWDNNYFYISYEVTDLLLENPSGISIWLQDAIELYLDAGHEKSSSIDATDYQYIINAEDSIYYNHAAIGTQITHKTLSVANGYNVEMAIPWSQINTTPVAGKTFGIDFCNDDRDNGVSNTFDWKNLIAGGNYQLPNLWGDVMLSDTTVCTATNVDLKTELNNINIYPNPVNTFFTLRISDATILKNTVMKIYDVCGKEVKTILINTNETTIDRGELQSGIYFYRIINNHLCIANGKLIFQQSE